MPPNRFESEVESFLEGSHGDRTHIKRADHHTVTPPCGTLLVGFTGDRADASKGDDGFMRVTGRTGGRRRGLAGFETTHHTQHRRRRRCGGRRRGQAAVPVGGGGAWPGFEPTRRAKLAAQTASGGL